MDKAIMSIRMKKWVGILQEANASGMTKTKWCEQNGISRRQFFHWQKKIREYVLEQNPELGLTVTSGQIQQIRAINTQIVSSLPVFCELQPRNEASSDQSATEILFSAEAMIRYEEFQIYVNNSVGEKTLSTILSVIQHA